MITRAEKASDRSGVLVCHPRRQHSHQLAMALAEHDMLAKYVTGMPTRRDAGGWLGHRLFPGKAEAYAIDIDGALVRHAYGIALARKAAVAACTPRLGATLGHRLDGIFDRYFCGLVSSLRPEAVVAYENSALCTFRRAKRLGIKTVLDAASVHHVWQDRFHAPVQGKRGHQRTKARKDAEIGMADEVLTVSELARESYVEAGVPPERVRAIPVGVDIERFRPVVDGGIRRSSRNGVVRFVYVGNAEPMKGLDVLSSALRRLREDRERPRATLIGDGAASEAIKAHDDVERIGWLSHDRLAYELPQHDVLVLPSYFDSFGMVVAEAMACGLPVIVTENVGAKQMVTPGVNGLVVPAGDAEAFAEAMRWFIQNCDELPTMSCAARASAEQYDWSHYRRRIVEFFQSRS